MATNVMKFGGTSVGSPEAISQTAEIIQTQSKNWDRLAVVVSAMSGVTNVLISSAQAAVRGDQQTYQTQITELSTRHTETIAALLADNSERAALLSQIKAFIDDFAAYCRSIHVMGEITPRGMDTISSLGERMNARVIAAVLRQHGLKSEAVDATELIVTDDNFQDAIPLMEPTRAKIQSCLCPLLDQGIVPVVTGFIGATESGVITTLGRGGSDYTAAILGDCLDADEVWTWTDVDGVMTADPRVVPDARVIPEVSFNEISELAYFGAKVLHPKTIRPIMERDIPLWVKNTFNPGYPGTRISQTANRKAGEVTSVALISKMSMVTVAGRGMMGVPGIAARTFSAVAKVGASVLMISQASSEQSICFVIPTAASQNVIVSLEGEMALELARRDIDSISAQDEIVILSVVGSALRHTPGVAARIFGALGNAGINVIAIAQGSSEYSISLVLDEADAHEAMRQIHLETIVNGK